MINEIGGNLDVLILTETGKDWETFATWYSLFKNIPEAHPIVACQRTTETPALFYQWMKRLKLSSFYYNCFSDDKTLNKLNAVKLALPRMKTKHLLVVKPLTMALDCIPEADLNVMNNTTTSLGPDVWFFYDPEPNHMMDKHLLAEKLEETSQDVPCHDAKTSESLQWLVTYQKGCGRWIHTLRGCPFSNAAGLVSEAMTVNELRIIELWKKMAFLYNAVI